MNNKQQHPERVTIAHILLTIQKEDERKNYPARNKLIWTALALCGNEGMDCGVRLQGLEPKWPVVYINLPIGNEICQVNWSMPAFDVELETLSDEEKYSRIASFGKLFGLELNK